VVQVHGPLRRRRWFLALILLTFMGGALWSVVSRPRPEVRLKAERAASRAVERPPVLLGSPRPDAVEDDKAGAAGSREVRVVVADASDRTGLAGAKVWAFRAVAVADQEFDVRTRSTVLARGTTARTGEAALPLPSDAGKVRIVARAEGFAPAEASLAEGSTELTLLLDPGLAIDGIVIDDVGAPVPNAHIVCRAIALPPDAQALGAEAGATQSLLDAVSEQSGRFRVGGLAGRPYLVSAHAEGWLMAGEEVLVRPPASEVKVVLVGTRCFVLRLLHSESRQPASASSMIITPYPTPGVVRSSRLGSERIWVQDALVRTLSIASEPGYVFGAVRLNGGTPPPDKLQLLIQAHGYKAVVANVRLMPAREAIESTYADEI
jgi:hypothetical protein